MSQVAFSERCGISDYSQLRFEKDQNQPGSAYLLKLDELGVDVNYVLFGRPGAMTPEEAVLLNAFRAADANTRKTLLAHALVGQSALSAEPRPSINAKQVVKNQKIKRDQNNHF